MSYANTKTPESDRDEARTPRWLFDWLNARFNFQIDLAATPRNCLTSRFLTKADDALSVNWASIAYVGFCNPPYSRQDGLGIESWLYKGRNELRAGFASAFPVPALNGEEWTGIALEHATEIIDIVGRVNFLRPDGTEMKGNNRGSCIVIFEPHVKGQRRWWIDRDEIKEKYS